MSTFDLQRLLHWQIPAVRRDFERRDTILYALGVGVGADPCDEAQLRFVLEDRLEALPSLFTALAYPALWYAMEGTGVDIAHVVHAELGFENLSALPVEGAVQGSTRVVGVRDKGTALGALLDTACDVTDLATGVAITRITSSSLARNLGGMGSAQAAGAHPPSSVPAPQRPPDLSLDIRTLPQAALMYRLSGDPNPLHSDPQTALRAGFPRPILHGRCTFGIAAWALTRMFCNESPEHLVAMSARFSRPVFPGEVLRLDAWREGDSVAFQAVVPQRAQQVLTHGKARLKA